MERQWREASKPASVAGTAEAQARADQRFIDHAMAIDAPALDEIVELDRSEGRVQRERRGNVIGHLLAHQLHHRGQAHAMLAGTDIEPPQLDEFLMPSEAHLRVGDLRALCWTESTLFA